MHAHLSRREFMEMSAAGLASLASLALPSPGWAAKRNEDRPNILFLAVDDLNDWVGCYGGHPQVKTPNLDRLAKRSCLFESAYCSAPLCNPSRTALMTGLRPSTTGIYRNATWFRDVAEYRDIVTLPQHLRRAGGYRAYGGGKIYHHPGGKMSDPASWNRQYSTRHGTPKAKDAELHDLQFRAAYRRKAWQWAPIDVPDERTADWQTADGAAELLKQSHDEPFFLACGIFRPHLPWYAPRKYFQMYPLDEIQLPKVLENDLDDVPDAGRQMAGAHVHEIIKDGGQWKQAVQAYLACVSFADACVGHVLDALHKSEHKDNTIVVLWGDHGWHLGEKQHWAKYAMWEQANHTPLMIRAPGVTKADTRCARPVSLQDLYPTLSELCGLAVPDHVEGRSLKPLLQQPDREWEYPAVMTHKYNNHAVRSQRWKYIRYEDGSEELYDHDNDPLEWHNLAGEPKYASVKQELAEWFPKTNAKPRS
mgnify:FL=1